MCEPQLTTSREALRHRYGVSAATFRHWLRQAGITHRRTKLMPSEVQRCYDHLGEPDKRS